VYLYLDLFKPAAFPFLLLDTSDNVAFKRIVGRAPKSHREGLPREISPTFRLKPRHHIPANQGVDGFSPMGQKCRSSLQVDIVLRTRDGKHKRQNVGRGRELMQLAGMEQMKQQFHLFAISRKLRHSNKSSCSFSLFSSIFISFLFPCPHLFLQNVHCTRAFREVYRIRKS
jgi:hypothetical protein